MILKYNKRNGLWSGKITLKGQKKAVKISGRDVNEVYKIISNK